ncbi:MAG: hypothetical protein L0Z47_02550 [Actinobacteria bacterium]|nr:hypothetical protein [Actinomycetota bacterium]
MIRGALLLVALVLVGCTTGRETVSVTTVDPRAEVAIEDLRGRLVTVDAMGNIVVTRPDGSGAVAITDDAGEDAAYAQPSWSVDGTRIAWSEVSRVNGVALGVSDPAGESRFSLAMEQPPFYFNWAPDGRTLGVLRNGDPGSIAFELVDVAAEETRVIDSGVPYFLSWSPRSDRLAVHVDGTRFDLLEPDGSITRLGGSSTRYAAPHWTAAGIFHLGTRGIELTDPDGASRLLVATPGPVTFVANPAGTKLAAQAFQTDDPEGVGVALVQTQTLPGNSVVVIDVATGEMETVTRRISAGFFWSPDGESLLVLEPELNSATAAVLVWRDGQTGRVGEIGPHPLFVRDVLQFFDQYAQSHRLWAPDSNAVALPGAVDGDPGVWVYRMNGEDPVKVADGSWVMWSAA